MASLPPEPIEPHSIFAILESVTRKPRPFAKYTASELWTDEHTSERMLAFHLDGDVDISSRRTAFIDESVSWMTKHFALCEKSKIIDFGCGPGLYTSRFDRLGADVYGVDFSSRSIAYARSQASMTDDQTTYIEANYLDYEPEGSFDLITMIMCDYCAFPPSALQCWRNSRAFCLRWVVLFWMFIPCEHLSPSKRQWNLGKI